jgi:hypothetical protein
MRVLRERESLMAKIGVDGRETGTEERDGEEAQLLLLLPLASFTEIGITEAHRCSYFPTGSPMKQFHF